MDNLPLIKELTLEEYFKELEADSLYPSAGSSLAVTAAHAAALFTMFCRVNLRQAREKETANQVEFWKNMLQKAERLSERALALAQEDGFAIREFVNGTPQGPSLVIEIPLEIARCAEEIITAIDQAFPKSYPPVRADAETARCLAVGSKKGAIAVARYNLPLLDEDNRKNYVNLLTKLES